MHNKQEQGAINEEEMQGPEEMEGGQHHGLGGHENLGPSGHENHSLGGHENVGASGASGAQAPSEAPSPSATRFPDEGMEAAGDVEPGNEACGYPTGYQHY